MASKTIKRASRDLFSLELALDVLSYNLKFIIEDLEEAKEKKANKQALSIRNELDSLTFHASLIRREWENAENKK